MYPSCNQVKDEADLGVYIGVRCGVNCKLIPDRHDVIARSNEHERYCKAIPDVHGLVLEIDEADMSDFCILRGRARNKNDLGLMFVR